VGKRGRKVLIGALAAKHMLSSAQHVQPWSSQQGGGNWNVVGDGGFRKKKKKRARYWGREPSRISTFPAAASAARKSFREG